MIRQQIQIRPFHVNVPEAELTELRRRINATRWPERETVADASQGVQLETTQKLARYWATDYDWPGLGTASNPFRRGSCGLQITAQLIIHPDSDHRSRFQFPTSFCRVHAALCF
jgi:hypothetical protein